MKVHSALLLLLKGAATLVLLALGVFLVLWPGYVHDRELRDKIHEHQLSQLEIAFDTYLYQLQHDLRILTQSPALSLYLERGDDAHREVVEKTLLSVSALSGLYDQVRFIDPMGRERLRVNRDNDYSYLIDRAELQNKRHRDYVQAGLALPPGGIYVSRLDLNIENRQVEQPFKPMLRLVGSVFTQGEYQGMLVLNAYGQQLLDSLRQVLPQGRDLVLLSEQGDWLAGGGERDWHFMFGEPAGLSAEFPALWRHIRSTGQGEFELHDECHIYRWFQPEGRQLEAPGWLLAQRLPDTPCNALLSSYQEQGGQLLLLSASIALPLVWLWSRSRRHYLDAHRRTEMSEQQLRLITDQVGMALIMVDHQGRVCWMNPEAEQLLGWSEAELGGRNLHQLVHVTAEGMVLHEGECPTLKTLRTGERQHSDHDLFRTRQGDILPVRMTVTPFGDARERGAILSFSDNSRTAEREHRLQQQANTDELTGVLNRRATLARLQPLLSVGQHTGVLLLDIDYFKQVNDQFGHASGDRVLIHFCKTVSSLLRRDDIFGRIGGEEFLVVLADTEPDVLLQLGERIRSSIEAAPCMLSDATIAVTVSIGASMQQQDESAETLIARADHALYAAKRNGRNRVEWGTLRERSA